MTDPKDKDLPHIDLEPVRAWFERWEWARVQKASMEAIEKEARDQIEVHMGDREVGLLDNVPVITWKWSAPKTGRVDTKMLRENYPDIAAICTVKQTSRSFRRVVEEE